MAALLAACAPPALAAGGFIPAAGAAGEARPLAPAQRLERHLLQLAAANLRLQAEASRLVLARSGNPAVKELAQTVIAHHQAVQPELLRLLHVRGMAPPMMAGAHAKLLQQLGKLNGTSLDRLYVAEVVQRSTQEDIANYERLAAQAQDPVLRSWADRQLPALRFQHAKAGRALPAPALRGQRAL